MNLIEVHILQSFPVTCLNRDDVGAPKSALFGGVQRARVSSQCWKRAIRQYAQEILNAEAFSGVRTRYVVKPLTNALKNEGFSENEADELAVIVSKHLNKDIDSKDKRRVKTSLFLADSEITAIAKTLRAMDTPSKLKKRVVKNL